MAVPGQPSSDRNPRETAGTKATIAIAMISTAIKGSALFVIPTTSSPVIDWATNRLEATGGVTKAMHRNSSITRPNWIGLMPSGDDLQQDRRQDHHDGSRLHEHTRNEQQEKNHVGP